MKKTTLTIATLICVAAVGRAADVQVKVAPYVRNEERITAFDDYLRTEKHFRAQSRKDLEKNLRDDWILANSFLENAYTPEEKAKVVNLVNRYLAKREVQRIQKKIGISDDVLKSYYLDHISDYRLKPIVSMKIFHFKTLEDADTFFRFAKTHSYEEAVKKAEAMQTKPIDYTHPLNMMQPIFRLSMRNKTDKEYFTPPQFVGKDFAVLYVADIKPREGYVPFEKARKGIGKELWKKTYLRMRRQILDSYQDKK